MLQRKPVDLYELLLNSPKAGTTSPTLKFLKGQWSVLSQDDLVQTQAYIVIRSPFLRIHSLYIDDNGTFVYWNLLVADSA